MNGFTNAKVNKINEVSERWKQKDKEREIPCFTA